MIWYIINLLCSSKFWFGSFVRLNHDIILLLLSFNLLCSVDFRFVWESLVDLVSVLCAKHTKYAIKIATSCCMIWYRNILILETSNQTFKWRTVEIKKTIKLFDCVAYLHSRSHFFVVFMRDINIITFFPHFDVLRLPLCIPFYLKDVGTGGGGWEFWHFIKYWWSKYCRIVEFRKEE